MAPLLVPYVWGATNTSTPNVPQPSSGTEERSVCEETSKADSSSSMVSQFVSISKPWEGVQTQPTPHDTYVQDAGNQDTAPSSVLRHRRANPLTPYKPSVWCSRLDRHGLLEKYPTLYHSLMHGFNLGIPSIPQSYVPPNSPSINKLPAEYEEIVEKEFHKGRYLGPFSRAELESIIGPFQSSPLSLVPKPGKPGKFCGVHDFSHPRQPSTNLVSSINSAINPHDFPCTWGTFSTISLIIFRLPPRSQASIRDVAEAYRTIPAHHSQWPGLVMHLREDNSFAANICNNFGLTSAGGTHGLLADAGTDIFQANRIGPLSKWVDDHIFFRIPRCHLDTYNSQHCSWCQLVASNGGRIHEGSCIWYKGDTMPDGRPEELMKIWPPPYVISPTPPHVPHMMPYLHMLIRILTFFQMSWASRGRPPKLSHLEPLSHTSALFGTSTHAQWPFQWRRSSNTSMQSKNGRRSRCMPWQRYKSYTVSYYMPPWLLLLDVRTLQTWKPCFQVSITVLLCHTPHPTILLTTSNGGQIVSNSQPSPEASLAQYLLWTSMPSLMPAQVSASVSQSETNGAPGIAAFTPRLEI